MPHPNTSKPESTQTRSAHAVLLDMERVYLDLDRLGAAVEIIGSHAREDGIDPQDGGAIEVLGEVIRDRAQRLTALLRESFDFEVRAAHG